MIEMKKRTVVVALAIIAIGFVGTGLSTLYKQHDYINFTGRQATYRESYGFPLGWYGYSQTVGGIPTAFSPMIYWSSLGPLLLDVGFWIAISFLVSSAAIKSVNTLHKTRASKNLSVINI